MYRNLGFSSAMTLDVWSGRVVVDICPYLYQHCTVIEWRNVLEKLELSFFCDTNGGKNGVLKEETSKIAAILKALCVETLLDIICVAEDL